MSDNNSATNAYVTAEWIRRPLADLGGVSPADAAADAEGRKKLDDLLIELAGIHARMRRLGLPAVNPEEIRKALGIETPAHHAVSRAPSRTVRAGPVKRNALLDELGTALTGGDVDSVAFFNGKTGAVEHFMHNLGDQENARIAQAEADPDLRKVTPVTTEVRYAIMSDFIGMVEDIAFAGKLRSAISGKGAFRRFRETVDEDDALRRRWLSYRTKRHYHLALDWLHKLGLDLGALGLNPADFDWEPGEAGSGKPQAQPVAAKAEAAAPAAPAEQEAAAGAAAPAAEQAAAEVAVADVDPEPVAAAAAEEEAAT
jgi:Uncharacterised protein family (UPF0158)